MIAGACHRLNRKKEANGFFLITAFSVARHVPAWFEVRPRREPPPLVQSSDRRRGDVNTARRISRDLELNGRNVASFLKKYQCSACRS
jgi:hypothetical protein